MSRLKTGQARARDIANKKADKEGLTAEQMNFNIGLNMMKRMLHDYAFIAAGESELSLEEQEKTKILVETDILDRFTDQDIKDMVNGDKDLDPKILDLISDNATDEDRKNIKY